LLSFFHGFTLITEKNIYRNIALLKSLWNYLSNVWSFIENRVQQESYVSFTSTLRAVQNFRTCCTWWFGNNRL
jgi:hypothetical protein